MNCDLFKKLIKDLFAKLATEALKLSGLTVYLDLESASHKEILMRIALLLSDKTAAELGITDSELEDDAIEKTSAEMQKIVECLGEILEDIDINVDVVDQMKQIFLLIDTS